MIYLLLNCYLTSDYNQELKQLNIKYPRYPLEIDKTTVLNGLYIPQENQFEEIEEFVSKVEQRYGDKFKLERICDVPDIRQGLRVYLNIHPNVKAIFVGTRQSDSDIQLKFTQPTDSDWPQVIRVHPILYWTFQDIWKFIRSMNIHYCSLYDRGFTSLGTKNTTIRHPALEDNEPADLLPLNQNERDGRGSFT